MANEKVKYLVFQITASVLLCGSIVAIAFWIPRSSFESFFSLFVLAFLSFYFIWLNRAGFGWKFFFWLAVALRIGLLFSVPQLSNDFYRFLWDGEIMTMGFNPYANTPDELMSYGKFMADPYLSELYSGMGPLSAGHYSCYPVLNQFLFLIASSFSNSIAMNVILLKIIVVLADIGVVLVGRKILTSLHIGEHQIWLYALNPLVLLEFAGNAHFDGVMVFFVLMTAWFLLRSNWLVAGFTMGLAIQIKLLPLILIPFLIKKIGWFKSIGFFAMVAFTVLCTGLILLNEQYLFNAWQSIRVYFVSFEFNGGIYYLLREWDYSTLGWNNISENGPLLARISFCLICLLALFKSLRSEVDLFKGMMFALLIYLGLATTIHPWYIAMPLALSVFTGYRAPLIWSLTVMLSYSAYQTDPVKENALFLWFEYLSLLVLLGYEVYRKTDRSAFGLQLREFFGLKSKPGK